MNYQEMKRNDLRLGYLSEEEIHSKLEDIFGTLNRTSENPEMGKYYEFDKYNDNFMIEIKTRKINHNQYPTLIFGENKLNKGDEILKNNPNMRIFYLWRCNDKIVGWEHRKTEFSVCEMGRYDRGKREIDYCVNVKTNDMNELNNLL